MKRVPLPVTAVEEFDTEIVPANSVFSNTISAVKSEAVALL